MENVAAYFCINKHYRYTEEDLQILVEAKKNNITKWCNESNMKCDFYVEYIDGIFQKNKRPILKQLKNDIKDKQINIVVIDDLYSLFESMEILVDFVNYAEEYNCEVKCIDGTNVHGFKDIAQKSLVNQTRAKNNKKIEEENLR